MATVILNLSHLKTISGPNQWQRKHWTSNATQLKTWNSENSQEKGTVYPSEVFWRTLSGSLLKSVRTTSLEPNLETLKRRMMSWRVAETTKYSCFKRSSLPSKNCNETDRQTDRQTGLSLTLSVSLLTVKGVLLHKKVQQLFLFELKSKRKVLAAFSHLDINIKTNLTDAFVSQMHIDWGKPKWIYSLIM